jgi:hypothetical protein
MIGVRMGQNYSFNDPVPKRHVPKKAIQNRTIGPAVNQKILPAWSPYENRITLSHITNYNVELAVVKPCLLIKEQTSKKKRGRENKNEELFHLFFARTKKIKAKIML